MNDNVGQAAGTGKDNSDAVHSFPGMSPFKGAEDLTQTGSDTQVEASPFGTAPHLAAPLLDPAALPTQQPHSVAAQSLPECGGDCAAGDIGPQDSQKMTTYQ